jgi:hypothetical protein
MRRLMPALLRSLSGEPIAAHRSSDASGGDSNRASRIAFGEANRLRRKMGGENSRNEFANQGPRNAAGGNRSVRPPRASCAIRHPTGTGEATPRWIAAALGRTVLFPHGWEQPQPAAPHVRRSDRFLASLRQIALFSLCTLFIVIRTVGCYAKSRPHRLLLPKRSGLARV